MEMAERLYGSEVIIRDFPQGMGSIVGLGSVPVICTINHNFLDNKDTRIDIPVIEQVSGAIRNCQN